MHRLETCPDNGSIVPIGPSRLHPEQLMLPQPFRSTPTYSMARPPQHVKGNVAQGQRRIE